MKLSAEQLEAIDLATTLSNRICCVTGQAGTGKTTILKHVYAELAERFDLVRVQVTKDTYEDQSAVMLCAPTGRAATRIEEATGIPAMTIHRMLRFNAPVIDDDGKEIEPLPAYDKLNPMPYDVVIVDEASMVATELYRKIIDALKPGAVIRFFGDLNQLPPIGDEGGSPFGIALKKYPSVTLTENFRSGDDIIDASDKVIRNRIPSANNGVLIHRANRGGDGMEQVLKLCRDTDFTAMENQIICPTRANKNGSFAISTQIQTLFNPSKEKLTVFRTERYNGETQTIATAFKRGDKVIWTKNDYTLGLFNGQIGRLLDWQEGTGDMLINFDGQDHHIPHTAKRFDPFKQVEYSYDPRTQIDLAYAITTHKAQGSQFDTVMYVVAFSRAGTRQNVYTALTRAKNKIVIIDIGRALSQAIMNKTVVD